MIQSELYGDIERLTEMINPCFKKHSNKMYVDYELECQFADYKNNILAFGTTNRNDNGEYLNFGKSGNVIKMGAGLYEQMEVANTMYYYNFSLEMLEDALYELSASKLGFGDRHFVLKTGEYKSIPHSFASCIQ